MDLQEVIDEHYVAVRRTARAITRDDWEADEITQETFMIACRSLSSVRDKEAILPWLISVCVRVRRSRFRRIMRQARNLRRFFSQQGAVIGDAAIAPEESEIWLHVRRLPAKQSEVITLRYLRGLSTAEVAAIVGCSEGTVKSRLHHGLKRLKENTEFRDCYENS